MQPPIEVDTTDYDDENHDYIIRVNEVFNYRQVELVLTNCFMAGGGGVIKCTMKHAFELE